MVTFYFFGEKCVKNLSNFNICTIAIGAFQCYDKIEVKIIKEMCL